jgi:hypothetical protein
VHVQRGKLRVADYAKTSGFPDRVTRVTWAMPHADPPPEGGRRSTVAGRWVRHIDLPENRDPWDAPIRNDVATEYCCDEERHLRMVEQWPSGRPD